MIFQPLYFGPVYQYKKILEAKEVVFEVQDNYQKQTYRTRQHIYGANGFLSLNIPIIHGKGVRQKTKEVRIENKFPWQKNHFKSLENAYRSSPYFEFYEDDLSKLYSKEYTFLIDFLFDSIDFIWAHLPLEKPYQKTKEFQLEYPENVDMRHLANAKDKSTYQVPSYIQVFENKHGFIPNLSILDLLFNEGPNAANLLT